MHVYPGLPPYTDTNGSAKIRIGCDCQPLTGTLRRRISVETGETDFTAVEIPGNPVAHLSASAMERLRAAAREEKAPEELIRTTDLDLLGAIGVLKNGRLTRAGILIGGSEAVIQKHVPGFVAPHLRMRSDTEYTDVLTCGKRSSARSPNSPTGSTPTIPSRPCNRECTTSSNAPGRMRIG